MQSTAGCDPKQKQKRKEGGGRKEGDGKGRKEEKEEGGRRTKYQQVLALPFCVQLHSPNCSFLSLMRLKGTW